MTMTFRAFDPSNVYPLATLYWRGPGWYAFDGETGQISHFGNDAECPDLWGTGWSTAYWAETPEQALGNYADHIVA